MSWLNFRGRFLFSMEATATVVASHSSSPLLPSLPKEWPSDSDNHILRNKEKLLSSNWVQSDEGKICEVQHGREHVDIKICSVIADGSLDNDTLQQQISGIKIQREELHLIEIECEVQGIARTEIIEIRNNFNAHIEVHEDAATILQEQLCEWQRTIHGLEKRFEKKDRELIKQDNQVAWTK